MRMRVLKCWGIGAAISTLAVASTVIGVHTPLAIVGFVFGLPLFVATAAVMRGEPGNGDYVVMVFVGSLLYGFVLYLALLIVQRVRRKNSGTRI